MKIERKTFPDRETQKELINQSLGDRLFVDKKIPITGRSSTNYSIQLFPDISTQKLYDYLKDKDYLDLACGVNHLYRDSLLYRLSKRNPSKKRHGLDIHSKTETFEEIEYYKGSALRLSFPNNSYDCITINNYLYFWENKDANIIKIFKELHKVCKVGGEIRIFPIFFGNYYNDNIELFDMLNELFSVRLLRPKRDYSKESPIYLENKTVKRLEATSGQIEHKANHTLMSNTLILKKL